MASFVWRIGIVGWLCLAGTAGCASLLPNNERFSYERMRVPIDGPGREAVHEAIRESAPKAPSRRPVQAKKPASLVDQFKRLVGRGARPEEARARYAEAEDLYRRAMSAEGVERTALWSDAGKKYADAAEAWPDSSLEQDALFLAGEAYFFADAYPESNSRFETLLKKHPNSRYIDLVEARRFAIARYWLDTAEYHGDSLFTFNVVDTARPWRDTRGHAMRIYDRIRIDDPTGKLADDATMAAGNAHFADRKWIRADEFYSDIRKTFPRSDHQFLAHYLGAQAKIRSYEGSDYSGVPLDEAEELLKQIRRQFPAEFEKHRADLERMYAEVRFRKAERDWTTARYYEKQKAYGAARFYYDIVARDYDDTPFAKQARTRVGEIAHLPAKPDQKFEWIVEQLPSSRDSKPLVATGLAPSTKR
ncbi:MAG: outer membrane protein assembly factor BamD [Planctomycetes bacterium]|nr:outer membrane protein assembly factor BamD [Planctomycetota bacterium]